MMISFLSDLCGCSARFECVMSFCLLFCIHPNPPCYETGRFKEGVSTHEALVTDGPQANQSLDHPHCI